MSGRTGLMSWRLALALMLPTSAFAAPPLQGPQPPPVQYAVELPPPSGSAPPHGWGLYAVMKGRALDLASRGQGWSDDPAAPKSDLEAGYGWWSRSSSAVVGYVEHDPAPSFSRALGVRDPTEHKLRGSGVLGVGFTLHAP